MRESLRAAREAQTRDEVPVGTCVLVGETLLAVAGNRTRTDCDPTAHAEIVALREAAWRSGNYRLPDAVVYSTIEPCAIHAGNYPLTGAVVVRTLLVPSLISLMGRWNWRMPARLAARSRAKEPA